MKKVLKNIARGLCIIGLAVAFQACEQEGPAEEAGENIDNMMESAQESFEGAGEKMAEMIEQGKQQLEEAGEKMGEMVDQGEEQLEETGEQMQQ